MSRWFIVPIRGLSVGKSRLASLLDPERRLVLNQTLLERVLDAVAAVDGGLSRCMVATAGEDALNLARKRGATGFAEPRDTGLNGALEAARIAAKRAGATSIVVLAADLPDASGEALARLIASVPSGHAAVIADKDSLGTNGLVLPIDCPLRFSFGTHSLARHISLLRKTGSEPIIWNDPALAFDVDSPADYQTWQLRKVDQAESSTAAIS